MLRFWQLPRMSTSQLMLQVPFMLLCFFILHCTLCLYSTRSVQFVSSGQLCCTATCVSKAVCTHLHCVAQLPVPQRNLAEYS